jgi:hypothetical protein
LQRPLGLELELELRLDLEPDLELDLQLERVQQQGEEKRWFFEEQAPFYHQKK